MKQLDNSGDKATADESGVLHSDFMSSAEQMQQKLGPALCLAKWQQTSLHLTTGHTNSCYHPPLHRIDANELQDNPSALHNTVHKKNQRARMLSGEKPEECSYCWRVEATGNLSDRHYRSGEPWAAEKFSEILVEDPLTWNVNPAYVEVNFNSACNLSCSYCSPQFSSSWMKEINDLGAYPTSNNHNSSAYFRGDRKPIPNRENNPYVDAFWRWWPELYPNLKHFRMTGGEPLMDRNTYRVFDYVLENPKKDLHLNVTSNFSQDEYVFDKYLTYVKHMCGNYVLEHFMQFVSIDGYGERAEYARHGLDFKLMQSNVEKFLTDIPGRNSITFIITMNVLNITSLQELMEWILKLRAKYNITYQRIWFDTPILREPAWQCIDILPESYAWFLQNIVNWMHPQLETVDTRFRGFKDYEVTKLQRVVDWMHEHHREHTTAMADFYRFFDEHDRRRKTNFLETFPEMSDWYNNCKYWADNNA
jgi:organic radical activating enzyme